MPNTKIEINQHLLTQKIEKSKHMGYYDKKVKLTARVTEYLRDYRMEKGTNIYQSYLVQK